MSIPITAAPGVSTCLSHGVILNHSPITLLELSLLSLSLSSSLQNPNENDALTDSFLPSAIFPCHHAEIIPGLKAPVALLCPSLLHPRPSMPAKIIYTWNYLSMCVRVLSLGLQPRKAEVAADVVEKCCAIQPL